jgi:SIR2-like protein
MNQLVPPYGLIREVLCSGRVIPFVGSGASLGGRQIDSAWMKGRVEYLPTAVELASHLAKMIAFPDDELPDLSKVAQYYDVVGGRQQLEQELHRIFNGDYPITSLHTFLAGVSISSSPLLIVTTNYDDLIERALNSKGCVYDVVTHTTNPDMGDRLLWLEHGADDPREVNANKLDIDLEKVTVVYKMHGTVDRRKSTRGQYVITENDYIDFLTRMTKNKAIPSIFAEPFQTRPFLFLGYGLYDWNLRVVLNRIEKDLRRRKGIKSWAIQHRPKALEQRFWQERGVEVYNMTIEDFITQIEVL